MLSQNAIQILATLPAFRGVALADRDFIVELFEEVRFQKGDLVFRKDDPGDALFLVASGSVDVVDGDQTIGRLGPGEWFGEMALITGERRSATIVVALDCHLLVLRRDAFERLVDFHPQLYRELADILSRRLARRQRGPGHERGEVVALENRGLFPGRRRLLEQLAEAMELELGQRVPIVTAASSRGSIRARPGQPDAWIPVGSSEVGSARRQVAEEIAELAGRHHFVLLEIDEALGAAQSEILELADTLVVWSGDAAPQPPLDGSKRLLVLQERAAAAPGEAPTAGVALRADDPARSAGIARLARRITRRSVGLALGSGAAFGLAHIGVLEELERRGSPVDFIAGASIGAIVAVLYAQGTTPERMRTLAARLGNLEDVVRMTPQLLAMLLDINPIRPGLFSGENFERLLGEIEGLGERNFADLDIPVRVIATDIETGARVEISEGPVVPALRASCSAPWVLSPRILDGRLLIDGGMSDPVPSDTVRNMGADRVIAVNVVPPLAPAALSPRDRAVRGLGRFNPFHYVERSRALPNSFDVVARTLQIMQHELGNTRAGEADYLLCPDLRRFWLLDFWRAAELIEEGAREAATALPEIEKQLANS